MRLFVLAFVLGTLLLQHAAELPRIAPFPLGIAALLALRLCSPDRRLVRTACLLIAGALTGAGLAAWRAEWRLSDALPLAWEGEDIELVGVICGLPQPSAKGTRFLLDVERIVTPAAAVPKSLSITWYAERTRDHGEAIAPPKLSAGERWRLTVRLKRPRGLSNPHGFDFEPWALERGIRATGYVRTKAAAQRLDARVDGWPYTLHRWRGQIRDSMAQHLGESRLRGVLVALAIGDQDAISADDWEVFWRTGVGHLMSISGVHITMLAGLAFVLTFFLWVRVPVLALRLPARKAAIAAGTLAALAYCLMTGYGVPAQRTFVMLATLAACVLLDRHGSPSRVLALAALAVVAVDPWAVLSAGFWLSFGAVAAIFYVMALRTGRHGRLATALAEQLAVTVVMVPMLVALFQEYSLVSPIANALAIPIVSLAVAPLTIAGAFLPLPGLLDAAHALMLALMSPLERLAALPMAMLESHAPAGWTVAAGVIGCAWILAPCGFPLRSCGAVWAAPMFMVLPPAPPPGEAWLDVLDVGNGLAVIVRTSGHALAYDTGPSWQADADSGSRIVVPFLRGEGVRRLDGVVVSHADDDHYGGAASIAYSRSPGWLLSSLHESDVLHGAFEKSIRCEAGQHWKWDGVEFVVMHPGVEVYEDRHPRAGGDPRIGPPPEPALERLNRGRGRQIRKENDRSCVLRVATTAVSALLTGDIEARGEAEMLARGTAELRSDVILVPHHGSKTSSTPAFIDAVDAKIGLLSVGYRNRFRHPNAGVVIRYLERGVALRRTDREGALQVQLPARPATPIPVEGHAHKVRYWSERRRDP